jgi:CelD/BcsL family acetyltransferase involved in cellulose biosynthesis
VWDRLAARSGNIFSTRAWAECWWQAYGAPGRPLVLTDGPDPSVVVPLHVTGRPVRQLRLLGAGPADQLGPACAPEDLGTALELVRRHTGLDGGKPDVGWDVLLLQDVAVGAGWQDGVGGTELRRVSSPVVLLGADDWDGFLATRSKNFREQTRRRERKLRAAYDVTVREATAETLAHDLDELFRLHRLRWGDDAPFATGMQARFTRLFAAAALSAGWLRLWVVELDGRPAAALLGYRFGEVECFYQSGRDPAFEDSSVGTVLLGHAIRAAVESGASEYRLLRGDEGYKSRWADEDRPVHTVGVAHGPLGRLAVRAALARRG